MSVLEVASPNAAQIDLWNTKAGRIWVEFQEQLDRQVEPFGQQAIHALAPTLGEHVLDIGCGCGQTTLELAARVGPSGLVVGVDISTPMLEVAQRRIPPAGLGGVEFRHLDAQQDGLGSAVFNAAFSRFGVMFFSDPEAAFKNIWMSLKVGGRLAFVCWRGLDENTWMQVPLEAARKYLMVPALAEPFAPGPFAFADASRIQSILYNAGFAAVNATPFDFRVGGADIEQTLKLALRVGPLGAILREHPELEPSVIDPVRDALRRYLTADGVRMPGATWIISARKK